MKNVKIKSNITCETLHYLNYLYLVRPSCKKHVESGKDEGKDERKFRREREI